MKQNKVSTLFRNGLLALFMLAGISSFAQKKNPEERAKMATDSMKVRLSLSDDQYQKVYTANLAFMNEASAVRTEGGDKTAKMTRLKSLNKEHDSALKSILNEEQYNQYQDNKKANRKQLRGRMKSRR